MALIKCPECGREGVSDSAESCPSCGYNVKAHYAKLRRTEQSNKKIVIIIIVAIIALRVASFWSHWVNSRNADPFKEYYSDLGRDVLEIDNSKYTVDSSMGFDILKKSAVEIWGMKGRVMIMPNDEGKLGICVWMVDDIDLNSEELSDIIQGMNKLYGESEENTDIYDQESYTWNVENDITAELFYYEDEGQIMIRFLKDFEEG